jgi:RHS repeat-associated protein
MTTHRLLPRLLVCITAGLLFLPASSGPQSAGPSLAPGQTMTPLPDGRLLIFGGWGSRGATGNAIIYDPRSSQTTVLAPISPARAWHSATVLPDGTVLILGGIGSNHQPMAEPQILDPQDGTVQRLSIPGMTPRAHHTATLLTDGRVLVAGGNDASGHALAATDVWTPHTGALDTMAMSTGRSGHTAILLGNGTVLLWAGTGASIESGEIFDPETATLSHVATTPSAPHAFDPPRLEASFPAADSAGVAVDSSIALRFSKPLRMDRINDATVTLSGPQGPEPLRIVAAEGGMLAFVTPVSPLIAGSRYSLVLNGPEDLNGYLLPFSRVEFRTAGPAASSGGTQPGSRSDDSAGHAHHAARSATAGTRSEIDDLEWKGPRRDGKPYSRWQSLPPLTAPPGTTALAGQVLRLNGQPLADVTLRIGAHAARTDHTGRFLLMGVGAGRQELIMDGSTANEPGRTYGTFDYGVDITSKTTTVLPFTIWMPLLDMQHATSLPAPTPHEIVARSPRIPGLEVHVPAGVILQTDEGPLPLISLTQIPVDRPPYPVPPGTTFFFTPQGHGAQVLRTDGTPSPAGVRIVLPNVDRLPPATRLELTHYSYYRGGWTTYGEGAVSADGRQIVPDPGVEFKRLGCAHVLGPDQASAAPIPGGLRVIDPIDLGTGLFTMEKVDLVLPDVIPIVVRRQYRPGNINPRLFGDSMTHSYMQYLVGDQTTFSYAQLVLPDGGKLRFNRISPGTDKPGAVMEHTATPTGYYKARLTWNAPRNGWDITLADGTVYQFTASGEIGPYLMGIRDRVGNQLTISRTMPGNNVPITRITSPNGRWVDFTYITVNTALLISQIRDNLGRTVSYTYHPGSSLLKTVTDAGGGVTEYTWSFGRIATIRDPPNIVWLTNEYDAQGRVIRQTQADGTFYQLAYTVDGQGRVTQTDVTDPKGHVRRVTFNPAGYPLTDTWAYGTAVAKTTVYSRDATSNLVSAMTDALGRQTAYSYNNQGKILTITRLAGTADAVTTSFSYESSFNQLAAITDPLGHTTSFGRDTIGNLTTVADALGHQTTLTYNGQGQLKTMTDALGNTATLGYYDGDLATITDPTGRITTRFTDGGGRLIAFANALGQQTRYDYDALNRMTKITDALGGQTQLAYDGNGNVFSLTDARSNTTSYTYSSMDRVATRTDPLTRQESYGYDSNGNRNAFTDRKGQVTSTMYDALDRPTLVTYQDGSTSSYAWDAGNRLTQTVDSLSGAITRTYDGLDRLIQEVTPQGAIFYTYDAAGRRVSMTVLGQPSVSYTYDAADRLTQITQGSATVTITYDAANRRTSLTLPNGVSTEYAYDAASRLTGLAYRLGTVTLGTLTYAYDAAGNRTVLGGTWARTGLPSALTSATYNAANQQLTFESIALTYDLNGNLTSDGTNTYSWDARNRLVSIAGGSAASFQYDAQGRRTSKTIDAIQTGFLYDGWTPVQELNGSSVVANLLAGVGIDEYLTRTDANGSSHFLTDALGSTIALSSATGALPTSYTYTPFGETSRSGSATANAFDYTGREDDGTGLKYYRARYYSSTLQRFVSEDPQRATLHLYGYVGNSPLLATDPLGLYAEPLRGGFGRGPIGPSGSGGRGIRDIRAGLDRIGQQTPGVSGPRDAADVIARLRAHQQDPSGVHVVCHSRGCDQILDQLRRNPDVRVDTLITLDCFGFSGSCGTIPDNVRTNINYWQDQEFLHGGPNHRADGSGASITNIQRTESHTGIPGAPDVQLQIIACIGGGDCPSGNTVGPFGGRK